MSLRHDLHSHSTASDGTLTPAALVTRAQAQAVEVLALTDHDCTDGLAEADRAARELGVRLVPGVEISVTWSAQVVHIVGLHIERGHAPLQEGLARLCAFRDWRAAEMGRRLAACGIPGAFEGARALAQGAIVSRTHFARFLVSAGHARDVQDVFNRFLVRGKPGHVPGAWATLEECLAWIRGAGGQAVLAHPARYKMTGARLRALIGEFTECGGTALEVVSGSHSPADCQTMAQYARQFRLSGSAGSDYHGPQNPWIELGRLPALPAGVTPVWDSWC